jgi:hypothetical protein
MKRHTPYPSGRENPVTGRRICVYCKRDVIMVMLGNSVMGAVWEHASWVRPA